MTIDITSPPNDPFIFNFAEPVANPSPDQHFEVAVNFTFTNHGVPVAFDLSVEYDGITLNFGNVDRDGNNPGFVDLFIKNQNINAGIEILGPTSGRITAGYDAEFEYYNRLAEGQVVTIRALLTITDEIDDTSDDIEIQLKITGRNDLPTAANDKINVLDNQTFTHGGILANDDDPDLIDVFTVTGVGPVGNPNPGGGTVFPAEYKPRKAGKMTFDADSVTFTPDPYFKFLAKGESAVVNVTYTMSDGHGGADTANIKVTIKGQATLGFIGTKAGDDMLGENDRDEMAGRKGNDEIFARGGNDLLLGDAGNDVLVGGRGADDFAGGTGNDIIRLFRPEDSPTEASLRDQLFDFERGDDKLDLKPIDAKSGSGNDAFSFIGTKPFSGKAGELRIEKVSPIKVIAFGNVNADKKADFAVEFLGLGNLGKGDFDL
jgi:hypothetical protein